MQSEATADFLDWWVNRQSAAPSRCELCGASLEGITSDQHSASDVVRILAEEAETNWVNVRLLLLLVAHPQSSYAELARIMKIRREAVGVRLRAMAERFPNLAPLMGASQLRIRAQRKRRKHERESEGKESGNIPSAPCDLNKHA